MAHGRPGLGGSSPIPQRQRGLAKFTEGPAIRFPQAAGISTAAEAAAAFCLLFVFVKLCWAPFFFFFFFPGLLLAQMNSEVVRNALEDRGGLCDCRLAMLAETWNPGPISKPASTFLGEIGKELFSSKKQICWNK